MANLIVTERWIKDNGLIQDNTDPKLITPIIVLVQDLYIHPILGTDLYEEILSQIETSTVGTYDDVSAANIALLDGYVLPCIMWYVLCECSPAFQYRYLNKGVMSKSSDNSTPVDLSVIKYAMDKWKNHAEVYAQRTTKFLTANTDTYPKYIANTDENDISPNRNNFTSSLYLGDDDEECCPGYYD